MVVAGVAGVAGVAVGTDSSTAEYRVRVLPARHEVEVELALGGLGTGPVELSVPTWVPGAYGFMKYGRDLFDVRATDAASGQSLPVRRSGWSGYTVAGAASGRMEVRYRAWSFDPAWGELAGVVEHHQAVLLGTRHLHAPAHKGAITVAYLLPDGWPVHHPAGAVLLGGGRYQYPRFAAFLDTPVVVGEFERLSRLVEGVPFHFVFLDRTVGFDAEVGSFLDAICAVAVACHRIFGSFPFASYSFIFSFSPTAHWGLEHENATMVGVDQTVFVDDTARARAVRVCAHELFHAWNVCRMKPAPLGRLDPVAGGFPDALWIGEGFTRYYEFLLSVRAGAASPESFFSNLINYYRHLVALPAYERVSAADSSLATFLNHNRYPGSVNSSIDYYDKGMLVAFDLDASFRLGLGLGISQKATTLDEEFRAFYDAHVGVGDGITTADMRRFYAGRVPFAADLIAREVERPGGLSTVALLEQLGFEVRRSEPLSLGLVLAGNEGPRIENVLDDGPAGESGLAPGDEIVSAAGFPFQLKALRWLIARGETIRLEIARGHRRHHFDVTPRSRPDIGALVWRGSETQAALIRAWLERSDLDLSSGRSIPLDAHDNFHGIQTVL